MGRTPLHWTAATDAGAAARVLLDRGASVHARAADGSAPLRVAARRHAWRAGAVLLARGADIKTMDDDATSLPAAGSETPH